MRISLFVLLVPFTLRGAPNFLLVFVLFFLFARTASLKGNSRDYSASYSRL